MTQPSPQSAIPANFDATWRERLAVLGGAACTAGAARIIGLVYAHDATLELMGLLPVTMVAAGKFLPLWGVSGTSHFTPWELGMVIWALDTMTVLVIVYALEGLYRVGPLRRGLVGVQGNARLVLAAYPRIRRTAVIGVLLFVLFPVAGTGALVGSFVGILLGLHRRTLIAAVSAGGLLGGMAMAAATVYARDAILALQSWQRDPAVRYATIAALAVLAVAVLIWLRRSYRNALARAAEAS